MTKWDWEACMTLPENQWGYHKDWSLSYVKNPVEVLERIVHAVSMGGNMVVNFGPQADGDFRTEEKEIAKAIGKWMQKMGNAYTPVIMLVGKNKTGDIIHIKRIAFI